MFELIKSKENKFLIALRFRFKKLFQKTVLSFKLSKKTENIYIYFKILKENAVKNNENIFRFRNYQSMKKKNRIFSDWKAKFRAQKKKAFIKNQCNFFYETNTKFKIFKTLKLLVLQNKKILFFSSNFLKLWTLNELQKRSKEKKIQAKKNQLVSLYYSKILMKKTFDKLIQEIFIEREHLRERLLMKKTFNAIKLNCENKKLQNFINAKYSLDFILKKKVFHRLFLLVKLKYLKNYTNFQVKSRLFKFWSKKATINMKKSQTAEFLLLEYSNKKQMQKVDNFLKIIVFGIR